MSHLPNISMCWPYPDLPISKELPKAEIYLIDFKFLCIGTLFNIYVKDEDAKVVSYLLKKIWHCRLSLFNINCQVLTINEYKNLAEISRSLSMADVTILKPDGTMPSVEELLNIAIYVKSFRLLV